MSSRASVLLATIAGAAGRLNWRAVHVTVAIAVAFTVWSVFEFARAMPFLRPPDEAVLSLAIRNLVVAASIVLMTLFADEVVARGARRFRSYALGVAMGSAAGALADREICTWLDVPSRYRLLEFPTEVLAMEPVFVFFESLTWGSIIVFLYVHRRNAMEAAARLSAAQLRQATTRRLALEARLHALHARIEPQSLFRSLAEIRDLYESDPVTGSQVLSELIVRLRAASGKPL